MATEKVIRVDSLMSYIKAQKMLFGASGYSPFQEGIMNGFTLVEEFAKRAGEKQEHEGVIR